ncbi:MAG TPA: serine hydrolase [Polyangia bacterium]|nr:serine hydrolase [Polyangia bacterium]
MQAALVFAAALVALPPQPAGVPWPTVQWPTASLPGGVEADAVTTALAAVDRRDPELGETRAVVIVQGGRIVAEKYREGYAATTRLVSWSMAKSITQALVGIAVGKGLVALDRAMGNPHWAAGDARAQVTWRQWLQMVDGQDYHEIGVRDPARNDAARMLFGAGRLDVAAFAASLPQIHPAGTHWNYNTAGIELVDDALGRVFAPGAAADERRGKVADVLARELFGPLGMRSALPEFDAAGTFLGGSLVYATARDFARFGLLYLRDGVWDGRRILPAGWVDFARTRGPAPNGATYGAGWWITPPVGDPARPHALTPEGPADLFTAQGHEGQLITLVPSKDLVIVRLGHLDDNRGWHALGRWLQALVAAFPDVR